MNVRFAADAVRCRVTQAEIHELLASGSLKLVVALPRNHQFQVTIRAAMLGAWRLDSDPTGLWIEIPRLAVQQLSESLPNREGIAHLFEIDAGNRVQVTLEVDVRRRPAPPGHSPEPAPQPVGRDEEPVVSR